MNWTQDALKAHITFMKDLNSGLRAVGQLVSAEGLAARPCAS